ncbi:hypothetical protein SLS61_000585 [Didymella pomorum]
MNEHISFEDIIQSGMFTFLVGEEKRPFVVHSKAIAGTSPVFDRLVNGGLKESQDRVAEIEDIDPETFTRFLETLVSFKLHPERLGDVVELARYAYENGEDRSDDGRIDPLRELVVNYVAREMKVLGKHAEFRNLMDGGGEFAGDFWDIVSQELL